VDPPPSPQRLVAREGTPPCTQIVLKGQKDTYQVLFFSGDSQREMVAVPEAICKDFAQYCISEKESPLNLYEAYLLARKEHARKKDAPKDSSDELTIDPPEWGVLELRDFLNELLCGSRKGRKMAESRSGLIPFRLKEEERRAYLREGFCQKLDFLINECQINSELLLDLTLIRDRMKDLLVLAFSHG
jgi:hypothetical protein